MDISYIELYYHDKEILNEQSIRLKGNISLYYEQNFLIKIENLKSERYEIYLEYDQLYKSQIEVNKKLTLCRNLDTWNNKEIAAQVLNKSDKNKKKSRQLIYKLDNFKKKVKELISNSIFRMNITTKAPQSKTPGLKNMEYSDDSKCRANFFVRNNSCQVQYFYPKANPGRAKEIADLNRNNLVYDKNLSLRVTGDDNRDFSPKFKNINEVSTNWDDIRTILSKTKERINNNSDKSGSMVKFRRSEKYQNLSAMPTMGRAFSEDVQVNSFKMTNGFRIPTTSNSGSVGNRHKDISNFVFKDISNNDYNIDALKLADKENSRTNEIRKNIDRKLPIIRSINRQLSRIRNDRPVTNQFSDQTHLLTEKSWIDDTKKYPVTDRSQDRDTSNSFTNQNQSITSRASLSIKLKSPMVTSLKTRKKIEKNDRGYLVNLKQYMPKTMDTPENNYFADLEKIESKYQEDPYKIKIQRFLLKEKNERSRLKDQSKYLEKEIQDETEEQRILKQKNQQQIGFSKKNEEQKEKDERQKTKELYKKEINSQVTHLRDQLASINPETSLNNLELRKEMEAKSLENQNKWRRIFGMNKFDDYFVEIEKKKREEWEQVNKQKSQDKDWLIGTHVNYLDNEKKGNLVIGIDDKQKSGQTSNKMITNFVDDNYKASLPESKENTNPMLEEKSQEDKRKFLSKQNELVDLVKNKHESVANIKTIGLSGKNGPDSVQNCSIKILKSQDGKLPTDLKSLKSDQNTLLLKEIESTLFHNDKTKSKPDRIIQLTRNESSNFMPSQKKHLQKIKKTGKNFSKQKKPIAENQDNSSVANSMYKYPFDSSTGNQKNPKDDIMIFNSHSNCN